MKLRWLKYALSGPDAIRHCQTGQLSNDRRHGVVLQYWEAGWGTETINGVHGSWVDVPIAPEPAETQRSDRSEPAK